MQTVGIAAPGHQTTGKGIDDHHALVVHDVVHVPLHDTVRTDRLVDVVGDFGVFLIGKIFNTEESLRLFGACRRQNGVVRFFVHDVIGVHVVVAFLVVHFLDDVFPELAGKSVRTVIQVGRFLTGARYDQRSSGFVNQNGVHLVHDSKVVSTLNHVVLVDHHVVPQIVKAELVVGSVGDICRIRRFFLLRRQSVHHKTGRQSHKLIDPSHFLAVTACQVVVDRHHVYALSGECVEIRRHGCHQRFSFTGFHFGNPPLMQDDTADDLDPERAFSEHTLIRFPDGGKGVCHNIVQRFPVFQSLAEKFGGTGKLLVCHFFIFRRKRLDIVHVFLQFAKLSVTVCAENLFDKSHYRPPTSYISFIIQHF